MRPKILLFSFMLTGLGWACQNQPSVAPEYIREISQWQKDRLNGLMAPEGWLSLAGLFWLEEGENTFGSDPNNMVVFPAKAPAFMGVFRRQGDSVTMQVAPGDLRVLGADSTGFMVVSAKGEPPIAKHGDLAWGYIQRGDKVGIRLRDTQNPLLKDTLQLEYYEINPDWRVKARMIVFDTTYTLVMKNVLGMTLEYTLQGALQFTKDGKDFTLHALDGGADGEFFLIFSDLTTGETTYPAGRYLYADRDSLGDIWVDFNKAYNPPCAFTKYATCLLPPAENHLGIAVTAGEKYADHGEEH